MSDGRDEDEDDEDDVDATGFTGLGQACLRLIKFGKEAQTKTGGKKNPEDKLQQKSQTRCCTKISLHFHSLCLFLYLCQECYPCSETGKVTIEC